MQKSEDTEPINYILAHPEHTQKQVSSLKPAKITLNIQPKIQQKTHHNI